jgi:carboxylate-amine ligase
VPDLFGTWAAYADYVDLLVRLNSVKEHTQLWWSIRPHPLFGTVEIRICDAQGTAEESDALAGLLVSCAAQAALDHDDGVAPMPQPGRLVEENLWRAVRYGLDGRMIDLEAGEEYPAAALPERLLEWTAPARGALGIEPALPRENGAQRQRRALERGRTMREVHDAEVAATQRTYALQEVST